MGYTDKYAFPLSLPLEGDVNKDRRSSRHLREYCQEQQQHPLLLFPSVLLHLH